MKSLSHFTLMLLIASLSSCRTEDFSGGEDDTLEPDNICLMSETNSYRQEKLPELNIYWQEEPPEFLPKLNIQPIFLEVRSGWGVSEAYHSMFRASLVNNQITSELFVASSKTDHKQVQCRRPLSSAQYTQIVNWLNTASVCKSIALRNDPCTNGMIAPSSIFAVDPQQGPLNIGLTRYALDNESSFCNPYEIKNFNQLISSFYENLDYENECNAKE